MDDLEEVKELFERGLANREQFEILKHGVEIWNKWRDENPNVMINLRSANFDGADLKEANLAGALLCRASFTNANLQGANFNSAHLFEAFLSGANLQAACFSGADLRKARLVGANLSKADLRGANLNEAILHSAILSEVVIGSVFGTTAFGQTDFSNAIGLESIKHIAPSIIDLYTINKSKGRIPDVFLRGCGLSDLDIEYAKLAVPGLDPEQVTNITYNIHRLYLGGGIQYYSCFISYNSKDEEIAKQLHDDLQNNGVRCWFAPEDMKIGDQIRPTLDRQIRLRDKLLVILSANSIKSEWVGDEVEGALEEEQKGNRSVLFPIRLDDTVLNARDDWAAKIKRRRHIGDFSNWKDKASYQKAFERLLRDLKASSE